MNVHRFNAYKNSGQGENVWNTFKNWLRATRQYNPYYNMFYTWLEHNKELCFTKVDLEELSLKDVACYIWANYK